MIKFNYDFTTVISILLRFKIPKKFRRTFQITTNVVYMYECMYVYTEVQGPITLINISEGVK